MLKGTDTNPAHLHPHPPVNNLYGHVLSMPLPLDSFEVIRDPDKLKNLDLRSVSPEDEYGYFVIGTWEYPEHLKDRHRDLPLIADLEDITYDDLSPYSRGMLAACYPNVKAKNYRARKLICTFRPKRGHMTHCLNARQYLEHGLKLTKLDYVIKFRQKAFVKDYITKCTELRRTAKDPFFKNVYKLMANSVSLITAKGQKKKRLL